MGIFPSFLPKMLIESNVEGWGCDCGNMELDRDGARFSIKENNKLIIYRTSPKN